MSGVTRAWLERARLVAALTIARGESGPAVARFEDTIAVKRTISPLSPRAMVRVRGKR
jgi:hypothetical protein